MFVIFGLDDAKPEITVSTFTNHCHHCNNTTKWHYAKHQTSFSLFFLPLFPVKTKYYYLCPICNHGDEISSNEYQRMTNQTYNQ
ncbi:MULTISPECIES: zinc-ribbon domain-containing protein [unclassified Lentimicrobium]|uniref:zinc-ribbon domain-containing protein n=1 Tax=unclassified Lentimicrobium TaxID=2677434 RepID=UPI0015537DB4|nr:MULTISPECIES: zinc-ribbon domain-containing protein [unclassified Lentimicrobium]NPD45522.1 zinc-ribbon domain-containing protein [Lentimicrobium sp. S6]NPD84032.1 zinc-ribbon domain-containing protein [Lentimicrobium sp. L6]